MQWLKVFRDFVIVILSIAGVIGTLVFMSNGTAGCTKNWFNDRITCAAAVTFNAR